MKEQEMIRCTIMRCGTSKGIFLKRNDLPKDPELRDRVILAIFGSPDIRQIDGLGGSDLLTSKVAIIGPSTHPDADIDYTFGQVGILRPKVDYSGICGNLCSGAGPYAIYHGLVDIKEPTTFVKIHVTNYKKILKVEIPVKDGELSVEGDYRIDGCPGTGAKINLDFSDFGGGVTNKLLPTGNVKDILKVEGIGDVIVSLVDAGNPLVFVHAECLGLKGTETPFEIDADPALLDKLERIRSVAAQKFGFVKDWKDATRDSDFNPNLAVVNSPQDYTDYTTNKTIEADSFNILSRLLFNQKSHKAYPISGTICTATAARIPGTIVNDLIKESIKGTNEIRIGHPAGIISIGVEVCMKDGEPFLKTAIVGRTARIIMDGYVFFRKSIIK